MNNQEILTKAIQKAVEGGLTGYWADRYSSCEKLDEMEFLIAGNIYEEGHSPEELIFNHDFAKALWGEYKNTKYESHYIPARGYPGEEIDKKDIKDSSKDENWKCTRCNNEWAKCLEKECNLIEEGNIGWKYHIQRMVIAEDPIEYLGANINV